MAVGVRFLQQLGGVSRWVSQEFQALTAGYNAWISYQHNPDGSHGAVTASSVTTASVQPTPATATTSKLGSVYDVRNGRVTGPWQFLYALTAFMYDSLTIGAAASSQVTIDTTSPSGAGLNLRTTKGIIPFTDNVADLGVAFNPPGVSDAANKRWRHVALAGTLFFGSANSRLRTGTGTPEGAVTGNVGDLWVRTNGGAGTTLYVKESGTGNTGWVGK